MSWCEGVVGCGLLLPVHASESHNLRGTKSALDDELEDRAMVR